MEAERQDQGRGYAAILAVYLIWGLLPAYWKLMAGIPPLAGFFGKFYIFLAAIEAGLYALAVIGVLTSVVAAFYYLRIVKVMYFDEPAAHAPVITQPDTGFRLVLSANVLALIGLGIFGGPLMTWCLSAVAAS